MRLVLDTNIVISGLLWNGPPRRLLDAAISGTVDIYTSAVLATELREALAYPKFARRITATGDSVDRCIGRFMANREFNGCRNRRGHSQRRPRR